MAAVRYNFLTDSYATERVKVAAYGACSAMRNCEPARIHRTRGAEACMNTWCTNA
jgi:hypothetical protein